MAMGRPPLRMKTLLGDLDHGPQPIGMRIRFSPSGILSLGLLTGIVSLLPEPLCFMRKNLFQPKRCKIGELAGGSSNHAIVVKLSNLTETIKTVKFNPWGNLIGPQLGAKVLK